MKGQHEAEYAWFAISDSLPGISVSAERAASLIVDACRHGDAELTFTIPARVAVPFHYAAPGLVGELMMQATRLLPGPGGPAGDRHRKGRQSESKWAPSAATTLSDRAAVANNEV
jgi:hypothetical protein